MQTCNCPEYLQRAEEALIKEEQRANYLLQPETKPKLFIVIQKEILEERGQALVDMETGCSKMFQQKKLDELSMVYRLFKRCPWMLQLILQRMDPYIKERGHQIVKDEEILKDPIQFTQKLLDLKQEMDHMVEFSFLNDPAFQKCRDLAFTSFLNDCEYSPHFIAAYCDNEMKKGLRGVPEREVESRLEALVRLFCCLHSRDLFIKSYKVKETS